MTDEEPLLDDEFMWPSMWRDALSFEQHYRVFRRAPLYVPGPSLEFGLRHSQVFLGRSLNSCREERSEMVTQAVVPAKG